MPTTKNTSTVKEKTTETKTETKKVTKTATDAEKRIAELEEMVKQLLAAQKTTLTANAHPEEEEEVVLDINPNKKTKITSLTYGTLSLYAPNRGFLNFEHYGETKVVNYAQLTDFVNSCHGAFANGLVYIQNKDMVMDLGLDGFYETLFDSKFATSVISGDLKDYQPILTNATEQQKESFADLVAEKVYKGEMTDLNLISDIGRCVDVDIMKKVREMEETDKILNRE